MQTVAPVRLPDIAKQNPPVFEQRMLVPSTSLNKPLQKILLICDTLPAAHREDLKESERALKLCLVSAPTDTCSHAAVLSLCEAMSNIA